ncbi:hypothetical protein BLNAU_11410 [Blattamonas nauphoetae]|uniref:Uncharacterized protein n=1 Tax=Blattamonas nauphoetae TaxID=2049346 RepID=A0ABQ9XPN0_9EUKA|nr:hypothetical protein BLNAU_11410 [Blattamonas nauphoetae]
MNYSQSPEYRLDNSTLFHNEGKRTGGLTFQVLSPPNSLTLTDILFIDNTCTGTTLRDQMTDCIFLNYQASLSFEFFDCFSTSAQPHCGTHSAYQVFPDVIGPSITSVAQSDRMNENRDGIDIVLLFEGVFTGTSRKYDVTLEDADGTQFVAENVSFSKTVGTVTIALSNPSVPSLSSSTTYTIDEVKKSLIQSTSNEFVVGGDEEPDWTWWHHTAASRAGQMVGLSFTTPKGPTLTNIQADLNPSNANEAIVSVTVSEIMVGSFELIVFDASDEQEQAISIGSFTFSASPTQTSSHTVMIDQSGVLSYGKKYQVKSFASSTLIVSHTALTFDMPDEPPRISQAKPTLSGTNETWVDLVLTGDGLPKGKGFTIVVKEMEGDAIKSGATEISLTGTISGSSGTTTSCTASVEIYNKTDTLEYSKKYKIISLSINGNAGLVDPTTNFTVPDSPCRLEEMKTPSLNGEKTQVSVKVTGVGFTPTISQIEMTRGDLTITSTSITIGSTTELTAKFQAGKTESGTELEFGMSYEIESVSGPSTIYVNSGVGFTVPVPGIVASTSTELNSTTNDHFKVIVNGMNFEPGTEWTLKLKDRDEEISVTMTSAGQGESSWVKAGGPGEIEFGQTYTLLMMYQNSNVPEHLVCEGISLTTPPGPALTKITCSIHPSNVNESIVSVTVSPSSAGSFLLTVVDESDELEQEISIGPFSFASSSTETSSHTVVIRPAGLLSYGKTYTVKTLSSSSMIVLHSSPTFKVPSLLQAASASLNLKNLDEVIVSLTAFEFPRSTPVALTIVEVDQNDYPKGSPFTLTGTTATTGDSTHILNTLIETGKLQRGNRFEMTQCDLTDQVTVLNGRVFFRVPDPPTLTDVHFSFATTSNTTFRLILEGTDFPVGETFLVSLKDFSDRIEVTFATPSEGSSAELALGWSDSLQFDTAYPLVSVVHKGSSGFSMPFTGLTLETGTRPDPLFLFANDSGSSDPKFCGSVARPCSSVDVAWMIVDAYSPQIVSLVLDEATLLSSPVVVVSRHAVVLSPYVLSSSLVIPSTASLGDSAGLISVAGTLFLGSVNVEVQIDALSFVLFDVKGGMLMMNSVNISGVASSSPLVDGIEGLCSWETGLIKLHEGRMETNSCEFSSIGMGAIWMESSNLSLTSTQILSNGARFSLFPSAQQDVMCESGNITILPNSSSNTPKDHWISSTPECSVAVNESELKSPHFVPSLDAKNCTSTLSKKKDSFSVFVVGSKLFPCGLKLEVSESSSSSSQSSQSNSSPVEVPLSFSSAESWNETNINLSIPLSSLSTLSFDEGWTARFVFGKNELTESFTFLKTLKERKAESLQQTLPWLIPVIVCSVLLLLAVLVFVVVVICRRRRQMAKSDSSAVVNQKELSENEAGKDSHEAETDMASDEKEDTQTELHQRNSEPRAEPVAGLECEENVGIAQVEEMPEGSAKEEMKEPLAQL